MHRSYNIVVNFPECIQFLLKGLIQLKVSTSMMHCYRNTGKGKQLHISVFTLYFYIAGTSNNSRLAEHLIKAR
jgi:hypothetical protein